MSYPEFVGYLLKSNGYDANIYNVATSGTVLDNVFNPYYQGCKDLNNPEDNMGLNPADVDYIFIMFGTNHAIQAYIDIYGSPSQAMSQLLTNMQVFITGVQKSYTHATFVVLRPPLAVVLILIL